MVLVKYLFFEVDKSGTFKLLYADAIYNELKEEAQRVFETMPQIIPATYNGNPTYVQFTLPLAIPLKAPGTSVLVAAETEASESEKVDTLKNEYDAIEKFPYENEEYSSAINIPLSHHNYSLFDPAMNRVGINNHTAQKPYVYSEVNKYYNFETENQKLLKNKSKTQEMNGFIMILSF